MKKHFRILLLAMFAAFAAANAQQRQYTQNVNPYIGTGDHGHTFLGANVPFGFVQVGPTQVVKGWDWCSGYHISDDKLTGFSHTHLSGTGIGDLGDLLLTPVATPEQYQLGFSHDREECQPGYYRVSLDNPDVDVELTATSRTALHRYTFRRSDKAALLRMGLLWGIGWDGLDECKWKLEGNGRMVTGYRYSSGWAKNQKFYFVMQFSRPVVDLVMQTDTTGVFAFEGSAEPLLVRVGTSAVSVEGAMHNLLSECPDWNFEAIRDEADRLWNDQLAKIKIATTDDTARRIFYTALYHTMIAPSEFCDVDGQYRGADGKVHDGQGHKTYTTFSLWDTYRAAHPLMTLIHPEKQVDLAHTFLNIHDQQGCLPVWHLHGSDTWCMVGNPGNIVLADLISKGFAPELAGRALEAMKQSDLTGQRSLDLLTKYGYIPYNLEPSNETVSKGLEYAIADGAAAYLAKSLGESAYYDFFYPRSKSWQKYFDRERRFMRGVDDKGNFRTPFNPFIQIPTKDDYTEGNAWHYTFLAPHDVRSLIKAYGGEKPFVAKLDSLFVVEGDMGAEAQPDISGLIGQYAHGNEPSHHVIYLYNYAGQPWKAADRLREVMSTLYHDEPAGLCGNEDVGQMSAWYIMSSMGLYQVEPAGGKYVIGSPIFDSAEINVGGDKPFTIVCHNNSATNKYVQRLLLNGKPYTRSYIMHSDIKPGARLEFFMGPKPSKFGTKASDRP